VNFRGIREGYVRFCSKKCSCTYNRRSQSQDIEKEKLFRERLGNSVSNTWKEKELDGTAKIIREKISNTCKITNSKLTDEERRDKYGWLHKLSEEERQDFINNVMKKTGYHTWKETVSDEELKDFYDKRGRSIAASKLGLTREEYLLQLDNLPEKEKYYKEVWLMTEQTYRTHWQVIDPERKRGQNYHLDHIYSVITGYFNQIDPDIIASIHNLQILPAEENMKKHHRCQINIDTLMEKYYGT